MQPQIVFSRDSGERVDWIERRASGCSSRGDDGTRFSPFANVVANDLIQLRRPQGIPFIVSDQPYIGSTKSGQEGRLLDRAMALVRCINDERLRFRLQPAPTETVASRPFAGADEGHQRTRRGGG